MAKRTPQTAAQRYNKADLYEQAMEIACDPKLKPFFIADIIDQMPCRKDTFYRYLPADSEESNALKKQLDLNKVKLRNIVRQKICMSDNPTLLIAALKIIGTADEKRALSNNAEIDKTDKGEAKTVGFKYEIIKKGDDK